MKDLPVVDLSGYKAVGGASEGPEGGSPRAQHEPNMNPSTQTPTCRPEPRRQSWTNMHVPRAPPTEQGFLEIWYPVIKRTLLFGDLVMVEC